MTTSFDATKMPLGALADRMGIKIVSADANEIVGTMPVEGNTQPYEILNGGASMVLVETLGSIGAMIHAGPDRIAVGIDINGTHHKSGRSGVVTGVAKAVSLGKSLATYEVKVSDDAGVLLCSGRITCMLRDKKAN